MILKKLVAASAAALIVLQTAIASAALDAAMWVNGAKSGPITGKSQHDPKATTVVAFSHGLTKPGDLKAAAAAGKRMHEPITVVVRVDGATADMYKAAIAKQDRLQVKLAFYRTAAAAITGTPAAAQQPYYTITLTDALLEKVEMVAPDKVQDPGAKPGAMYLRLQIAFEKIDWTYSDANKTSTDDWETNI